LISTKARVAFDLEARRNAFDQIRASKRCCVQFNLVTERIKAAVCCFLDNFFNNTFNFMSIFRQRDNEVVCLSNLLVLLKVSVVGLADSVDLANFTESTEKVIGRD